MWFGFADANNDGALEPGEFPLAVFPFLRPEGRREEYFHKQALLWMGECMRASWRCCGWARDVGGHAASCAPMRLRGHAMYGSAEEMDTLPPPTPPCRSPLHALPITTSCPADHHFTLHGADKVVDTLALTRLLVASLLVCR